MLIVSSFSSIQLFELELFQFSTGKSSSELLSFAGMRFQSFL